MLELAYKYTIGSRQICDGNVTKRRKNLKYPATTATRMFGSLQSLFYILLRASTGSTFAARRAGIKAMADATTTPKRNDPNSMDSPK